MSNVLTDIRAALETKLAALSGAWPIAYQNVNFTPPDDGRYFIATLIHAKTVGYAGNNSFTKYQGLLNVNVIMPSDGGMGDADEQAAAILAHFTRGTSFTSGSATVRTEQPYINAVAQDGQEVRIPVWVPWFCYV